MLSDGLQDLIVLPPQIIRRRVLGPAHAHVNAEPLDADTVSRAQEL
jgi:hypothetical protein